VDWERAAVHHLRKSSTFLSSVSFCIVSMNNEFSPVVLWLELSQWCNDIITIILGVKGVPLRRWHDQRKSQWIQCNANHDFPVPDRMHRPFRRCFSRSKPDLLMVRCYESRVASSRKTSRLIADPLNCLLRLNLIFLFSFTNFDFSLYTNKLKENFLGDNYWECILYGMQCSSKCSTAQVL
jgi:hypothetical protein